MTDNWRGMYSAPRDGTRVLGYGKLGFESEEGAGTVAYKGRWVCDPNEATEYEEEECQLRAWQPLPKPPTID